MLPKQLLKRQLRNNSITVAYNAGILLGVIVKAHGFDGTVSIKSAGQFRDKIHEMESVFVVTDGKPVPFFIAEAETAGDTIKLKFSGYESVDKISEFIGCKVVSTSAETSSSSDLSWQELTGFVLSTPRKDMIGKVSDVIENPGQLLLIVITEKGTEIMVPFHEDLIVSFDKKRKIISMDLPEGLLEIN